MIQNTTHLIDMLGYLDSSELLMQKSCTEYSLLPLYHRDISIAVERLQEID